MSPAEQHYARRCAPLDNPPATYRDGTRTPSARRISRDLRARRNFKRSN